ncbi:glycosyltransferase family 39 protein, partial [Bacteroidota bacterium]
MLNFELNPKSHQMVRQIDKSKWFHVSIILLIASSIRIIYFLLDKSSPLFLYPVIDETEFLKIGNYIAEEGFVYPFHFLHPPLYSYFLGILISAGLSLKGLLVSQMILAVGSCVFLYLTLSTFNRNIALITSLIWAIYPLELFVETRFLSENLFTFLSILLAYVLITLENSRKQMIWAGVLTALMIITKTQFILFFIAW